MAKIGFDIDSVLYPFPERFREYCQEYWGVKLSEPKTWAFYEDWIWHDNAKNEDRPWSADDFLQMHIEFASDDGYEAGGLIGGAETRMAIKKLRDAGHEIILVTARHTIPAQQEEIEAQTIDWLAFQGIVYDELHFERDKTKIKVDYFLDDRSENFWLLREHGVQSYLMSQPWNEEIFTTARLSSVEEYVEKVLESEKPGKWQELGYWREPISASFSFNISEDVDPETFKAVFGTDYPESEIANTVSDEVKDLWSNEREDVLARFAHELGKATGDGSKKRQSGEKPPWYLDVAHEAAIFSHLNKWKHGETIDPDSGAHTLVHLAWRCLAIACQEIGNTPDPMNEELA